MVSKSAGKALEGFRVLDFTQMTAGPYCTRWLADLGAEVIKLEPPEGDTMRRGMPQRDGASAYYGALNAGKKSIVLDLKAPGAVQAISDLCENCDVLVENFRPGVMARLGLGYEALQRVNPRLVYCSISGYGQDGPSSSRPAFAPMVHAASGYELAHWSFQNGMEEPANCGLFTADVLAACFGVMAVQAALLQRSRTGVGQHLDVTLMESILTVMVYETQEAQFPMPGRKPTYEPLKTTDGFVIIVASTDRNFENLCESIGRPEWRSDPRFATSMGRRKHWNLYNESLREWTATRSAAECESVLTRAGVPCSPYRTVREVMADPHFRMRGTFAPVADSAGTFLAQCLPFKMSGAPTAAGGRVASLGEHTEQILGVPQGVTGRDSFGGRSRRLTP